MRRIITILSIISISFLSSLSVEAKSVKLEKKSRTIVKVKKSDKKTIIIELKSFKTEIDDGMATIWISATDKNKEALKRETILKQMRKGKIKIYEEADGVRRPIPFSDLSILNPSAEFSITSVLCRDVSGSLSQEEIGAISTAMSAYIDLMSKGDTCQILDFARDVNLIHDFSSDKKSLQRSLLAAERGGQTSLYDALKKVINNLKKLRRKNILKLVIVLTDGRDTSSSSSIEEVIKLAKRESVPVFTIGYGEADEAILKKISQKTKGDYFHATKREDFSEIYHKISTTVRQAYIIRFPTKAKSSKDISLNLVR